MSSTVNESNTEEIKVKKPQSEAAKRAKAKYYKKRSESEEFRKQNAEKTHKYFLENRDECLIKMREYKRAHYHEIYEREKVKTQNKKLESIKSKLEAFDIDTLAKLLIDAKQTKLIINAFDELSITPA